MSRRDMFAVASFAALSVASLPLASPAAAQDGPAAPPADDEEIVVTATRRESPLANVPIAVSAIAGQSLQNSGASDIRQLNQLAPSLLVSTTGAESNAVARVRGVGTVGDNPGLESSVAVFIDGVYRSRTGTALSELGAVERVEVLRGPQGTLFGRNTSAGLINIVTRAPSFTFGGDGEISYGNYDHWRLAARVTGPLSDTVAASIDGVHVQRDGFITIRDAAGNTVGDTNDRDRWLLRGQLLIEPSDALSVRLIGDYSHRDESCCGALYIDTGEETGTSPDAATPNPFNRIAAILNGFNPGSVPASPDPYSRTVTITPGRDYVSRLRDWGVSAEVNYTLDSGTKLTSITAWRDYKSSDYGDYDYNAADLIYRDPNTFREFKTFTQELRAQGTGFGGLLDWLIGGYYSHEDLTLRDNIVFGADYGRFAACRLMAGSSPTPNLNQAQLGACANPAVTPALIAGTQAALGAGGLPAPLATALGDGLRALVAIPSGTGDTDTRYYQKSESWALFTHNIVHVTDTVDLTLGLRYTHETKRFSADLTSNNATCTALQGSLLPSIATNPALGSAAQLAGGILTLGCLGNSATGLNALDLADRISHGEFSGTAILSWKPTRALMVYASYARGYKSGGYNLDRFELGNSGLFPAISPLTYFSPRTNADAPTLRFGEETVNAYEIGLKYSGRGWSANVALFREEFSNFQLNTFNGTSYVVQNINGCGVALAAGGTCPSRDVEAGLVSQGFEVELSARPLPDLRLTGGFTYADSRYADRLVGSSDGTVPLDPALFLLPGQQNNNAPDVAATASLAWTPPIGSGGLSALFYVDGRWTGDFNTASDLYPEKRQDSFTVINARLGLRGPDQRWAVELWAQNLFDVDFSQIQFNSPLQSTGPNNQSVAQLGRVYSGAMTRMTNQIYSSYLGEPRTWGVTLRGRF